ncbi:MAG: hypothetical protein JWM58_1641 [Rhizobium sp.]|nr:hypothetical protein [Rhizobium sp.]
MTDQTQITIKTFSNGAVLTVKPVRYGVGELRVDGNWGDYRPFITPKQHSTGIMIHAVVIVKGVPYSLTKADLDAILNANKHYVLSLMDRKSDLDELERSVKNARQEVGGAWAASIEIASETGRRPETADQEKQELDDVAEAVAKFEAAKAADPEAWAALLASRQEARDSATWN